MRNRPQFGTEVCSAHAEVIPGYAQLSNGLWRLLRTRGGDPWAEPNDSS